MTDFDVLIVGGGPSGLMLANELGRQGVRSLLLDAKASTAFNPQANATQARTMEHYRRLGFAHEIRALGLPGDHPTDIAYFTRLTGYELARLSLPTETRGVAAIGVRVWAWGPCAWTLPVHGPVITPNSPPVNSFPCATSQGQYRPRRGVCQGYPSR